MPKARLALVHCKVATEGPWSRCRGNEVGLRITNLSKGERIRLVVDAERPTSLAFNQAGAFPTDVISKGRRYKVCKEADDGVVPSPTIVEVVLNG